MTLLAFFIVILIIVGFHEFGHFIIGKLFNFRIHKFSIGFGPALWKKRFGETEYQLALIPLGGYVKFDREFSGEGEEIGDERSFSRRPRWQRFLVLFAGPAANIVLAVAALFAVNLIGREEPKYLGDKPVIGYVLPESPAWESDILREDEIIAINGVPVDSWRGAEKEILLNETHRYIATIRRAGVGLMMLAITPKSQENAFGAFPLESVIIGNVVKDSAAAEAGLQVNDQILTINHEILDSPVEFFAIMRANESENVDLLVQRNVSVFPLSIKLKFDPETKSFRIGVALKYETHIVQRSVIPAARESVNYVFGTTKDMCRGIWRLLTGKLSTKNLAGPIGIAGMSGDAMKNGLAALLQFIALLSINLAIVNLLPLPVLDGGGIVITVLIEGLILRRNLRVKEIAVINVIGFLIILALMFFAFRADILRLLS